SAQPTTASSRGAQPKTVALTPTTTSTAGTVLRCAQMLSGTTDQFPVTAPTATPVTSPVTSRMRADPRATTAKCEPAHAERDVGVARMISARPRASSVTSACTAKTTYAAVTYPEKEARKAR